MESERLIERWWLETETGIDSLLRDSRANEAALILELERRIKGIDQADGLEREIEILAAENGRLDQSLLAARNRLARECVSVTSDIEDLIERLEANATRSMMQETQELFRVYAPEDLRAEVEASSAAMLEVDLRKSQIDLLLRDTVSNWLADSSARIAEADALRVELEAVERDRESLDRTLKEMGQRFEEHGVHSAVLRDLANLDDKQWFIEDVLEPYRQAADAEASMSLRQNVFAEYQDAN